MNKGTAPLFMLYLIAYNITAKATLFSLPSSYANCADSQARNKAKNALSLAETISPVLARAKIQRKWFEQGKKKQILVFKGSQSLFVSDLFRFVSEKKGKPIQSKSLFASDLFRFVSEKKGKPIQSKSLFASDLSRFVSEKKESQSKQILGKPKFVPDNGLSFPITRQKNKARRPNGRQAFSLKVVKVISPLTCGSTFPCLPR